VQPFLTSVKIKQADAAIAKARGKGFKTRDEIRERRKLKVLETVRRMVGSFTRKVRYANNLRVKSCMKYLLELERDGKITRIIDGAAARPRIRWFPIQDEQVPPFDSSHESSLVESSSSDTLAKEIPCSIQVQNLQPHQDAGGSGSKSEQVWEITLTNRHGRIVRKGMRGKRGSQLTLSDVDGRAWLAALIVGEGTIFTRGARGKIVREPRLAVKMQDKEALDKAGALMGVRTCAAGISKSTGRKFWGVQAVGGRAIKVIELLRPFLTPAKTRQCNRAILRARKTGFRTLQEIREDRKRLVEEWVKLRPGS
jgi:hypothetical protein